MAYEIVNRAWPDVVPPLTEQEAISAARRLYRWGAKRAWKGKVVIKKMRGRSIDFGTLEMRVDPRRGWHGIVHSMSHRIHFWKNRHRRDYGPHDWRHEALELALIRHVVSKGWLEGRLRREPKPKPEVDPTQVARERTLASISRWSTKAKRAENALRKLRRRLRYYDRKLAA